MQTDLELDQDDLYDDDQFYKEPETPGPEPKLQGEPGYKQRPSEIPATIAPSSVGPPLRARDESGLEGN